MRRPRLVQDQDGIALVVALGTLLVLSLVLVSLLEFTSSNARSSAYSKTSENAFSLAEAGLNNAFGVLAKPGNDPLDPALLPARTTSYERGSVTWSGSLDATTRIWTVTATGTLTNPTGPGSSPVRRTVSARVRVTVLLALTLANQSWNYVYSRRTGNPCDVLLGNTVEISSRMYVNGNLCMDNSAGVTGGPLNVRGMTNLKKPNDRVGSLVSPINEAHIAGGCIWKTNPLHSPCSSADNVFANLINTTVPDIQSPVPDYAYWYANARPGPRYPCTVQSGMPPVFDNNTLRADQPNGSVPGVFDLTPSQSYLCDNSPFGLIGWNATTRTLTVRGTIYIDGSVNVSGGVNSYDGQAAIYLSGTFRMSNTARLCAIAILGDCAWSAWDPNSEFLAFIAEGSGGQVIGTNGMEFTQQAQFQGGLFATSTTEHSNSSKVQGPVIAETQTFLQSAKGISFPTLTTVPAGLPGQPSSYAYPSPPEEFRG